MGLVLLNLGLALLSGFLWYKNNKHENYNTSSYNAFSCGFCLCAAFVIFLDIL